MELERHTVDVRNHSGTLCGLLRTVLVPVEAFDAVAKLGAEG